MKITEDVVGLSELLDEHAKIMAAPEVEFLKGPVTERAMRIIAYWSYKSGRFDPDEFDPDDCPVLEGEDLKAATILIRAREVENKCLKLVEEHNLNPKYTLALKGAIDDEIRENPKRKIIIRCYRLGAGGLHGDWFGSSRPATGGVLDAQTFFSVKHPALLEFCQDTWRDHPQVEIDTGPPKGGYAIPQKEILREHRLPNDLSDWSWAAEGLRIARTGLDLLGIDLKLSDYVSWTCNGDPACMRADAEFGPPEVFPLENDGFGVRLEQSDEIERIEELLIWKWGERYVSPLWEYLGWNCERWGDHAEIAHCISRIGEGIEAAATMNDPDFDPDNCRRMPLTATRIFEAGKAVTQLRVKLELEGLVLGGLAAIKTRGKAGAKGGEASSSARTARREKLLLSMEEIAANNPGYRGFGEAATIAMALAECEKQDPGLWVQGKGQIDEYVGELRRGEAGASLQSRYLQLFPKTA